MKNEMTRKNLNGSYIADFPPEEPEEDEEEEYPEEECVLEELCDEGEIEAFEETDYRVIMCGKCKRELIAFVPGTQGTLRVLCWKCKRAYLARLTPPEARRIGF